ncbi:hypothetical protein FNV43_RR22807 [Rhamnella rubrinervis]|uniref:Uncharacterized protein n=1 Tax=Rhamnella rubrinervis TaxID=2594499 RepID=A0A8K0GVH5_9ROSA|nr:hypothetical protein FNV43_RR22807 [Rhamnella rubrinervis]
MHPKGTPKGVEQRKRTMKSITLLTSSYVLIINTSIAVNSEGTALAMVVRNIKGDLISLLMPVMKSNIAELKALK